MTKVVSVEDAPVDYIDVGSGSPIVFVHGAYVTHALWADVIARLADAHRCVAPTFPFGAQRRPVGEDVDLGVVAAGRRIANLLAELDLHDVTLVANDTGGGIVIAALGDTTLDWGRVSRLVLTNCDSYEHFPPKGFAPLVRLCRLSRAVGAAALWILTTPPGRALFAHSVTRDGIDASRQRAIFGGFLDSAVVRREAARFTAGLHPRYTVAATEAISSWANPVLIAWGTKDKLFPIAHARRLADGFTNATLREIEGSSTYVMLDRPGPTAEAIRAFIDNRAL
ncbi:alpha/beta fold hydrolase [Mycobacterium arosiense]|uniref:Alpha/beta hydrolase n=1 Tax=Mycobacterium arosiense ATCC BAA-1401 = DSM 45069 TaxID=1265311 RepID=A0A1W9ZPX3_MYCAI|nr:alpha/beta hydrolase [Mycobacterium arosiense]ORA19897.1 alpha/beta hydrolase [Mycobacterium arosiense ATCC BAA-1401 = DSM 45069]